jgi:hypothetical protein
LNAGTYYIQVGRWLSGDPDGTTFSGASTYELQVSIKPPTVTDPLILDLDHNGYAFSSSAGGVSFDINSDGTPDQVAWNTSNDGILAMDMNGNGLIDNGTELFTPNFGGGNFASGGDALASLDSNHDSLINSEDDSFQNLAIWKDADADGVTDQGELTSLVQKGITSLTVPSTPANQEIDGQSIVGEGSFTNADGSSGTYVEVALETAIIATTEGGLHTGGDGDDVLVGAVRVADTLTGGSGADRFVFNDLKAVDVVTDYQFGDDRLDLTSLFQTAGGNINDYVSYDSLTGNLNMDVDGTGEGGSVTIATLESPPTNLTIIFNNGMNDLWAIL